MELRRPFLGTAVLLLQRLGQEPRHPQRGFRVSAPQTRGKGEGPSRLQFIIHGTACGIVSCCFDYLSLASSVFLSSLPATLF